MPPSRFLDTHIHLWPSTSTSPHHHAWMTPSHFLAKRHGIVEYKAAATPPPTGFIYVETDRYLPSATPNLPGPSASPESQQALETWAQQPLEEIRFLRRIADGTPAEGDGFNSQAGDGQLMKGCVVWAPFHLPPVFFAQYLEIAERVAGPTLWGRVVGFRFLLQGKGEGEVEKLVGSEEWVENIVGLSRGRGGKGWVFDVGVDTNRDGVEQLEVVADMIARVREREKEGNHHVRFVLNHLCKHPLSAPLSPSYTASLTRLSPDQNIYMKLSGAFNEFNDTPVPSSVPALLDALRPVLHPVATCFPKRIMFGSDWPVCNVGGPRAENENWRLWVEVVEAWVAERGFGAEEAERIWVGAGCEAYGIEM